MKTIDWNHIRKCARNIYVGGWRMMNNHFRGKDEILMSCFWQMKIHIIPMESDQYICLFKLDYHFELATFYFGSLVIVQNKTLVLLICDFIPYHWRYDVSTWISHPTCHRYPCISFNFKMKLRIEIKLIFMGHVEKVSFSKWTNERTNEQMNEQWWDGRFGIKALNERVQ